MEWFLLMNMTAVIVVSCIVVMRKIFIYRIPGNIWLLLWKVLIFRLLCPFTFKLRLKGIDANRSIAEAFLLSEKPGMSHMCEIIKIIWLIGGILTAVFLISSHLVKRRQYDMALPVEGIYFEEWKKAHSLKRKVEIKETDRIASPLTYGVIRPIILLPTQRNMKKSSLEFVLEHEFVHITHMDVLLKWVAVLVCSIYWYNPMIWVMFFFVNRDMELACDESLLKNQTSGYKKEYLKLLINLEEKKTKNGMLCSSFCQHPLEERIRVMIRTEKETPKNILISLFIICLITMLSIGIPVKAETEGTVKYNEISENVPNITGADEKTACEILKAQGFSYIIK